jgi:hypothetical protein
MRNYCPTYSLGVLQHLLSSLWTHSSNFFAIALGNQSRNGHNNQPHKRHHAYLTFPFGYNYAKFIHKGSLTLVDSGQICVTYTYFQGVFD